jgi:predicted ATPase/class 3 adenylate cyclase
MAIQPAGTVTLVFTDIEGSTKLLEQLGTDRYRDALALHREIVRAACARHDGYEVDYEGDAFFYAFASAQAAVRAVEEAMLGLSDGPIRIRVGIHSGEPALDPPKYVGIDVHRAARIMGAAHGGQVVLSPSTVALLPEELRLLELGPHRLKDLSSPISLHQLLVEGLAQTFPPLKTLHRTNLPVPATPFLGREAELQALVELAAESGTRLITLTGPGGSGKTRLALQLAAELADGRPGGVFWVPLAPLRDAGLVLGEIAAAAGISVEQGRPLEEVVGEQLARSETLLLLDNCEHLLDGVARLVPVLLAAAPRLLVVTTSREPLRLAGEREAPVEPLVAEDAVVLFVHHARAIRPGFEPDETVARIVERVDRLPLAIELAAARVRALPPPALLERLDRALPLLMGGRRDAEERQRTLRATIAWSVDLLAPDERELLGRLSVFAGGARLDALEEVAGAGLDTLESLVAKSLVRVRLDDDGAPRYWLLETIREFAAEEASPADLAPFVERHLRWYLAFATELGPALRDRRQPDALAALDADLDNVRVALAELTDRGRCDEVAAAAWELFQYWDIRELYAEALGMVERAVGACPAASPASGARLHFVCGFFRARLVEGEGSADFETAAALFAASGERDGEGMALAGLAFDELLRGSTQRAVELAERARGLCAGGDPWIRAWVDNVLGNVLHEAGRRVDSAVAHAAALQAFAELGDGFNSAILQLNLSESHTTAGEFDAARAATRSVLREADRLDNRLFASTARGSLANVELCDGRPREAAAWLVEMLGMETIDPRGLAEALLMVALAAAALGRPGTAIRAWSAGERVRAGRWLTSPSLRPLVDRQLEPLRSSEAGFDAIWAEAASVDTAELLELARSLAHELPIDAYSAI